MRSVFIAVACAFLTATCYARAIAASEYCPTELGQVHAFAQPNENLYSFFLTAESPRTVGGDVTAITDAGWFTFSFPYTAIATDVGHYANGIVSFDRAENFSKPLYVRFPNTVKVVKSMWVSDASSLGDGLGWQQLGTSKCLPVTPPELLRVKTPEIASPVPMASKTPNPMFYRYLATRANPIPADLHKALGPSDSVLKAAATTALWDTTCPEPQSVAAVVNKPVVPEWPTQAGTPIRLAQPTTAIVDVSISAAGSLDSAEIYQSSGVGPFDESALTAAKASTYSSGMVYCKRTPGHYLFVADFNPN